MTSTVFVAVTDRGRYSAQPAGNLRDTEGMYVHVGYRQSLWNEARRAACSGGVLLGSFVLNSTDELHARPHEGQQFVAVELCASTLRHVEQLEGHGDALRPGSSALGDALTQANGRVG